MIFVFKKHMNKIQSEFRAHNCAQLCGITRNCVKLREVYKARHCAQEKSTCVGNPNFEGIAIFVQNILYIKFQVMLFYDKLKISGIFHISEKMWEMILYPQ